MDLSHYRPIFDRCTPYLMCRSELNQRRVVMGPDKPLYPRHFDPQRLDSSHFLKAVKELNAICYGPRGMQMPDWVFYDCAAMPGISFGFAMQRDKIEPWVERTLKIDDDYDEIIPVSLFSVIPSANPDYDLGYTLCSLNQVAPGAAPEGLWKLTLALGMQISGVKKLIVTTQWRSAQFRVYAKLGALKLWTAWTVGHDMKKTATFEIECSDETLKRLLAVDDHPAPLACHGQLKHINIDDDAQLQSLQKHIEAGDSVSVVSPPEIKGSLVTIAVCIEANTP